MSNTDTYYWLKPYIQNVLRRAYSRTSFYKNALNAARRPIKDGRYRVGYECAHCGNVFPRKLVQVDHIDPVIPVDKLPIYLSYDEYVARLFTDALQILCKSCHSVKSAGENAIRREHKKERITNVRKCSKAKIET